MKQASEIIRPESPAELIAILEKECEIRRQKLWMVKLGGVALVSTILLYCLFTWITKGGSFFQALNDYYAFILVAAGGVVLSATHRKALLSIHDYDERLVGFLIEALKYHDKEVVKHAEDILATQLSMLKQLTSDQCRILSSRLMKSDHLGFLEAAIQTLGKFGRTSELDDLADFQRRHAPAKQRERFERLVTQSHQAATDIRLRGAKGIIESTEEDTKMRLENLGTGRDKS